MKRIIAGQNDAGQRLDKFLTKLLKDAPMSAIYKWIRKKRVKVNGKKQEISYSIKQGDVLELYINDEFFVSTKHEVKESKPLKVIYEDENILIADKPSGISAHSEDGSLLERIWYYLYQKGEYDPKCENTFSPALCNRIDKNTAGLVIAAKNAQTLRIVNEKLKNHEIDKFYVAKIEGEITPKSGRVEGFTLKNEAERKVYFFKEKKEGAKPCVTLYKSLGDNMVEVRLVTGRTHQIRATFSYLGHPLVGDVKYGAKKDGRQDFQKLKAYKIVFNFKTPADILEYLNGKIVEADKNF